MPSHKPVSIRGVESTIQLIPIFEDNYVFLGSENGHSNAFVVDPGEADAVLNHLEIENLTLQAILLTHEHDDHIGGVHQLMTHFPNCKIIGSPEMKNFLSGVGDRFIENKGTDFKFGNLRFKTLHCPGHTKDHCAYYLPEDEFLFCGDILFGMGCGRIISGTHLQQFTTLHNIAQLSDSTRIFCAHEYSLRNVDFLLSQNKNFPSSVKINESDLETKTSLIRKTLKSRLANNHSTVPLNLGFEKEHNPFLNCRTVEEFKTLRDLRDRF